MNSIKIEKGAIEELKRIIRLHDKMDEFLKSNDKDPSWDGDIYLYTDEDLQVEHIQYRIPSQVKGRNDEKLLNKNSISYPVEYKNLRNYLNDGGVCYFVIIVSNNGEKMAVFYNTMTPIKLASYLKNTEKKKADQTKNIPLLRLKNNDKNELYRILQQFGHDSKEQGTGELVRKAISIKDMQKIDSVRMTAFVSDNDEVMKNIKSGEACLFGHLMDCDMWIPFEYKTQRNMEFISCVRQDETFGVDRVPYYYGFEIMKNSNGKFTIRLSENLCIDIANNKINFELKTELEQIVKDIRFLEILQQGTSLYIGKEKLCDYENINLGEKIHKAIKDITQIKLALMKFEIHLDKRLDTFTGDDWKSINELINLYKGEIKPKNETAWHMWWWQGKVVPFFLAIDSNGVVCIENGMHFQHFQLTISSGDNYRISPIIMFKRDVWEKLYDVDEKILLEEVEKSELNIQTEGNFSSLLVELLAAYDTTKNEKYYDIVNIIADKLLETSPDNAYWKINKLQLIKRKRDLSEGELQELERIEERTNDSKVVCAVNILIDNKRKAKKELDEMAEEDKELFMTYPIYNLL
jgi:hypothetical protein